jgi:hypothetical protein
MDSPYKRMRPDQHLNKPQQEQHHHPAAQNITAAEFRDQAVAFLASRLMVSQHCPQAASLQLRPSLQKVQEELLSTITSAVQLKQNASLLVLGEPGIGKTLVRRDSLFRQKQLRISSRASKPSCMLQQLLEDTVVSIKNLQARPPWGTCLHVVGSYASSVTANRHKEMWQASAVIQAVVYDMMMLETKIPCLACTGAGASTAPSQQPVQPRCHQPHSWLCAP